jgi:hypothetical protein
MLPYIIGVCHANDKKDQKIGVNRDRPSHSAIASRFLISMTLLSFPDKTMTL